MSLQEECGAVPPSPPANNNTCPPKLLTVCPSNCITICGTPEDDVIYATPSGMYEVSLDPLSHGITECMHPLHHITIAVGLLSSFLDTLVIMP
eukprot:scaffold2556_cov425-Prasinococcus_capsulatus_cf.AAC.4